MSIDPKRTFLVSGQVIAEKVGGRHGLSPVVGQRVVVAQDELAAYALLATAEPGFRPVGHASLHDYEVAAAKLRAVATRQSTEWVLHVA